MESSSSPQSILAKKLLHMFRVVYYMLRKGIISKRKLMMDLHLLLKCGKIAGKALGNLITIHHQHHHSDSSHFSYSSFSCRSMNPNLSFYNPREVEFSCSNTPWTHHHLSSRRKHHHRKNTSYSTYDYEAVAAAFEMLNNHEVVSDVESVLPSPSPSPAPVMGLGKSPRVVRQLRITDSPFPIKEDEVADGKVDKEAEEFIRRFYEQLKVQQETAVATPEYKFRRG